VVQILSGLLAAVQLMLPLSLPHVLTQRLQSGHWLRLHVVAQDDSAQMQHVKLCVRDAVQACYLENRTGPELSMLMQATELLPLLTDAAVDAARQEGFSGKVSVALEHRSFDARQLGVLEIPAEVYPALMIRLGDAKGQNWWGLIDPELSLLMACTGRTDTTQPVIWDWSWRAFWAALLHLPMTAEGA